MKGPGEFATDSPLVGQWEESINVISSGMLNRVKFVASLSHLDVVLRDLLTSNEIRGTFIGNSYLYLYPIKKSVFLWGILLKGFK